nr:GATA transcription factor 16-like [Ipomoea trifida]
MVLESMAVDLSDLELLELLSEKIAGVPTRILEVPFAYEYSPELLPHWMENVPYYYCYTDKSEVSLVLGRDFSFCTFLGSSSGSWAEMVDLSDRGSESEDISSQPPTPEREMTNTHIKTCTDCGTTKTPL